MSDLEMLEELFLKKLTYSINEEREEVYIFMKTKFTSKQEVLAIVNTNNNTLTLQEACNQFEQLKEFFINNKEPIIIMLKFYMRGYSHGALMYS